MTTVTWSRVLAFRWARQHLAERAPPGALLDVVGDLLGVHAQLMSSAEQALAVRVDGDVPRALWEERTLVKTWAWRGTLHLVRADELGLYAAAQANLRPRYEQPAWLRHHGLERAEAEAIVAAIPEALEGGALLTREELAGAVAEIAGGAHLAEKLKGGFGDLLKPAAFRGDLCFAPNAGRNVRFARPDQWLHTPLDRPDPEAAVQETTRRYLSAYGPATREQYARWFGTPSAAQAGRWIRSVDAVEVDVEGDPHLLLAQDLDALAATKPRGIEKRLPAFDPYVVGAPRNVDAVVAPELRPQVYRPQGWISPVVAVDGRVVAVAED
jgi:hypothetical protein